MIKNQILQPIKDPGIRQDIFARMVDILGKEHTGPTISNPLDFIEIGEKGLPAVILNSIMSRFNLTTNEMADLLGVAFNTLYRWLRINKILDQSHSVKFLELSNLFLYGEEVFGSAENFTKWIKRPNTALGGMEPAKLMGMPEGLSKVKDLLVRIEYGVYS